MRFLSQPSAVNKRFIPSAVLALLIAVGAFLPAYSAEPIAGEATAASGFTPPRATRYPRFYYPLVAQRRKQDGLVQLLFMVDEQGEPFAPIVLRSTHEKFENTAIDHINRASFSAATLNGEPIESVMQADLFFNRYRPKEGITPRLIARLKQLTTLLDDPSSSQEAIDSMVLEIENERFLRGPALRSLLALKFRKAVRFGSTLQQANAFKNAAAFETSWPEEDHEDWKVLGRTVAFVPSATIVPYSVSLFTATEPTARHVFEADLRTMRLAEAQSAYATYQDMAETIPEDVKTLHERMTDALREGSIIATPLSFEARGYDLLQMPKRGFTLNLEEGSPTAEKITLRCERKFAELRYQAQMEYQIPDSWGRCWLQVTADKTTKAEVLFFDPTS